MIDGDIPLGRAGWFALLAAGLGLGLLSLAIARGEPAYSLGGGSLTAEVAGLLAGWSLIAAGLGVWARRPGSRFGPLVVAAGLAWFLAEWNNPGAGVALAFTAGLVLQAACPSLVGHAALAYPDGRLRSRLERVAVAVAYGGAVLALGILPALFFDPDGQGCGQCPDNLLDVHGDGGALAALTRVGVWFGLSWAVLLVALAGWRLARSTAARRRVTAPVLGPAIVYLILVAWAFQHALDRGFLGIDAVDRRLWLGQAVALVALALGVSWEWVRGRRTRSALGRLVVELAASPPPGGLGVVLARTLGDPSLTLLYPLPDGRRVDARGRPAEPGQQQTVTPLVRGGRPVALLAHRPGLLDEPGLAEQIAATARLALDNERSRRRSVPSWKSSAAPAPASWNGATPNGGGWSVTSTTVPSSAWSRWRFRYVSRVLDLRPRPTSLHSRKQRPRFARPWRSCVDSPTVCTRRPSPRRAWERRWRRWPNRPPPPWPWGGCHRSASTRRWKPPPTSWSPRPSSAAGRDAPPSTRFTPTDGWWLRSRPTSRRPRS